MPLRTPPGLSTSTLVALLLSISLTLPSCRMSSGPAAPPGLALEISGETWVGEAPGGNPQVEPHVVVDPRDPAHLVVAWMSVSSGSWEVRLARSTDGGRAWRRAPSPVAPKVFRAFDPWLAWAPDGSALYLGLIEVRSEDDGGQEWRLPVFRSLDGGATWSRWGEVPGQTLDRLVVLAGRSAVHVVASEAVADAPIVVARANTEDGAFELRGRYRPADGLQILSAAATTGDGQLVLSFTDRTSLQDHRPRPLLAVPFGDGSPGPDGDFGTPRRLGDALFVGAPQLAIDDSPDSPHEGRLYSVWASRTAAGAASLEVAMSDDGGATWSELVNLSATGQTTTFLTLPAVAVDDRGRLGVTWREHTGDLATGCSTLHFAASLDGGRSFPLHRRVSSEPSCPDRQENRVDLGGIPLLRRWPAGGDYTGLAVGGDGVFHPVWADSREGAWRIRSARVEVVGATRSPNR